MSEFQHNLYNHMETQIDECLTHPIFEKSIIVILDHKVAATSSFFSLFLSIFF
ncbi:hypothetical protein KFK09_002768 [Dendrobium nobile]|uniref:Uncharacterized protein n=1 Tax=Dendrobium nobile TaxID=94219 RepID=A0A8T3C4R7_DENNO|nr:hypothetical protein KFK09_002768 [Dendrobium nobile]